MFYECVRYEEFAWDTFDGRKYSIVCNSLSPERQQELRNGAARLRSLAPEERARIRENARRFRELPDEERRELRNAWERLRRMPAEERERMLDQLEESDP